ncbi:hypothetical protein BVX94_00140 [bacterium B17]|nr:hypothetical protein BVX94_00140 [bacterium B17]
MSGDSKRRILWVDDEPTVLMMVAMLLKSHNMEVEIADSAAEALNILEKDSNFDLIGTDVRMAKIDGLEMSRKIKEKYPHLPIVVLSAHASDTAKEIAQEIGVYAYINKPFQVDDLLSVINDAINMNIG